MKVVQPNQFKKAVKKLYPDQKADLDQAIKYIMNDPDIGQSKTGDLSDVLVYKFKMFKQLILLAYTYEVQTITLTLLTISTYENCY